MLRVVTKQTLIACYFLSLESELDLLCGQWSWKTPQTQRQAQLGEWKGQIGVCGEHGLWGMILATFVTRSSGRKICLEGLSYGLTSQDVFTAGRDTACWPFYGSGSTLKAILFLAAQGLKVCLQLGGEWSSEILLQHTSASRNHLSSAKENPHQDQLARFRAICLWLQLVNSMTEMAAGAQEHNDHT